MDRTTAGPLNPSSSSQQLHAQLHSLSKQQWHKYLNPVSAVITTPSPAPVSRIRSTSADLQSEKIIVNIRIYRSLLAHRRRYPVWGQWPRARCSADQSTLTPLAPSGPRTHARRHAGWRACDRNLPVCRTSLGVGPSTRSKNILGSNSVKDTQDIRISPV